VNINGPALRRDSFFLRRGAANPTMPRFNSFEAQQMNPDSPEPPVPSVVRVNNASAESSLSPNAVAILVKGALENVQKSLFDQFRGTYLALRASIVITTVVFLAVLIEYRYFGQDTVYRASISAYYHNQGVCSVGGMQVPVRDVFVGSLFGVALMLLAYHGFTYGENIALNSAAVGLAMVVIFPMDWTQPKAVGSDIAQSMGHNEVRAGFLESAEASTQYQAETQNLRAAIDSCKTQAQELAVKLPDDEAQDRMPKSMSGKLHYLGALIFFAGIGVAIAGFATYTVNKFHPTGERAFKSFYRIAAVAMFGAPLVVGVLTWVSGLKSTIFWVEVAGVGVFALYWAVKSWELGVCTDDFAIKTAGAESAVRDYFASQQRDSSTRSMRA
jgi:hypothetical protein